ncbi:hypothetical protein U9M48_041703 [Paspalum notatum var. saurae]|uniref:Uncharacterized protein n=1 Tax=Paspalum notatum var. saurae TaxID=547442 RepID=A0AAQ3XF59_PASNO
MGSETFLEILLAILLPPLGVFLRYGIGVRTFVIRRRRSIDQAVCSDLQYPNLHGRRHGGSTTLAARAEFWICLLLTILGYIPGIIYAVYVLVA